MSIALVLAPGTIAARSAGDVPAVSHWTSTETEEERFYVDGPVEVLPGGYRTTVGVTLQVNADDPRASGDLTMVFVYDYAPTSVGRGLGIARLVNEGGSFQGSVHFAYYPDGSAFRLALMEGQGGYEGLAYTMTSYIDSSGEGQTQGLIWEGEVPSPLDAGAPTE